MGEHSWSSKGEAEVHGVEVSSAAGNALASVGGFCAGDREIVDHQRLSGLGYCFSASLPPFLATAAVGALDVLESRADSLLPALADNAQLLRSRLAEVSGQASHPVPVTSWGPCCSCCLASTLPGTVRVAACAGNAALSRIVSCSKLPSHAAVLVGPSMSPTVDTYTSLGRQVLITAASVALLRQAGSFEGSMAWIGTSDSPSV